MVHLPSTQDCPVGQGSQGVHSGWQLFPLQMGLFGLISRHSSLLEQINSSDSSSPSK